MQSHAGQDMFQTIPGLVHIPPPEPMSDVTPVERQNEIAPFKQQEWSISSLINTIINNVTSAVQTVWEMFRLFLGPPTNLIEMHKLVYTVLFKSCDHVQLV